MNQLQLPLAPHNGTETSRIAASMVNVSHQESMVLAVLAKGGRTQDELSELTGLLRSAVAGRCNRLVFKGLIHTAGQRLTRYGRPAAVYWLTGLGSKTTTARGEGTAQPAPAGRTPAADVLPATGYVGT